MILLGVVVALLVAQPDLGQTILVIGTWGAMFFMAGMPWLWIIVIGGARRRRAALPPIRSSRTWPAASTAS